MVNGLVADELKLTQQTIISTAYKTVKKNYDVRIILRFFMQTNEKTRCL